MEPTSGYLNVATAVICSRVFWIFPHIQRPPSESLQLKLVNWLSNLTWGELRKFCSLVDYNRSSKNTIGTKQWKVGVRVSAGDVVQTRQSAIFTAQVTQL